MKTRHLSVAFLGGLSLTLHAQLPDRIWDGGASTNNWSDAANWEPDGLPMAGENIYITQATASDPTNLDIDLDAIGVASVTYTGVAANGNLTIDGQDFNLGILQSRHNRSNISWTTGNPQLTIDDGDAGTVDTAGLEVGMTISNGSGIPFPPPTIISIDGPNTFTISANPTSDQSGQTRDFRATTGSSKLAGSNSLNKSLEIGRDHR